MKKNYIDQYDVVDMINERTHYFKKDIRKVLKALEEIIYEHMQTATVEEPAQCRLFFGFVIGAKRIPEVTRRCFNQHDKTIPEHLNPYARFKDTFRKKINGIQVEEEDYEDGMDETAERDE